MTSEKKKEANRQNAKKSTGPKSKRGKKNSSMNAVKHGLSAKTLLLPGERKGDFNALKLALEKEYKPETATDQLLFQQLVVAAWRLVRAAKADPVLINSGFDSNIDDEEDVSFALITSLDDGLLSLQKHQSSLMRDFLKIVSEMRKAKGTKTNGSAAAN